MLRFVYIGAQIIGEEKQFAFYDTIPDKFIELDGMQVFDDWADFCDYWKSHGEEYPQHDLERFWHIMPREMRPTSFAGGRVATYRLGAFTRSKSYSV